MPSHSFFEKSAMHKLAEKKFLLADLPFSRQIQDV
jgi:hypothetical protein